MDQWLRMLNEFEYRRERLLQEAQEERQRLKAKAEQGPRPVQTLPQDTTELEAA